MTVSVCSGIASDYPEVSLRLMADAVRFLSIDGVEKAKSGHPGMPMGTADVATVLWQKFVRLDPQNPQWPSRDRFVLSAGHGSMLLYSLLYLVGFPDLTLQQLQRFRKLNSLTPGHPEYGHTPGVETTTGPLGQGIATAVGMALAEKNHQARWGKEIINHYTYVIAGDGDLMEGLSHEAFSFAGHHNLKKLIVFFDDNHISIDGKTSLAVSEDTLSRIRAYGWQTLAIDGHNAGEIEGAIIKAQGSDRPTLIACRTQIAFGAPTKAGTSAAHGAPLGAAEVEATREALLWPHDPFYIPPSILKAWRQVGERGHVAYTEWKKKIQSLPETSQKEIAALPSTSLPANWKSGVLDLIEEWGERAPALATRQLSQLVLEKLVPALPQLIGGSADLTGSNNTRVPAHRDITPENAGGNYVYYGVREHAMAAIMNGLSLWGGVIPYGGTFLVFSDYLKPALRLSALMKQRVIYVLTHDSIGLGEDGPTHQPIEHLAALRAIPNLNVFRPADGIETAHCWMAAIESAETPSVLVLSRQSIQSVKAPEGRTDLLANRGGYRAINCPHPKVVLIATGSEVELAADVHDCLKEGGIDSCVVSLPCWRLFDAQPEDYKEQILGGENLLRVSIEAASPFGWERYTGRKGLIFGIDTFGASAPYKDLYEKYQLTAGHIVSKIKETMANRGDN